MANKDIKIEKTYLYRYDLMETPSEWDTSYHSIEYVVNENGHIIHKNQSGLLFLFDSETVAIKIAEKALNRHGKTEFWLTRTFVKEPLRLLDLTGGSTLVMLANLFNHEIDVFNNGLTITGRHNSPKMETIEPIFLYLMQNMVGGDEYNEKWLKLHEPFINPGNQYSLLGQRLSDFNNGEVFKTLLIANKYDGYVFDESYGGSTICIVDSSKLSNPVKEKFDSKKLFEWNKKYYLSLIH